MSYIYYIYIYMCLFLAMLPTHSHTYYQITTHIYTYTFHTTDGMVQNFSLNPMFFPHDSMSWLTPERLLVILIDILEQRREMNMFTEFG